MDDEASPPASDASEAGPEAPDAEADESFHADRHHATPPLERRLRRLSGRKGPYRGPIVATTRGWVSRDSRWHIFAARFLDFAVLTPEHLVLCSTGFFTRRPRRQVLREALTRLFVTPLGPEPVRTVGIVGDFSRAIRLELRDDPESTAFVRELIERTPIDPRLRMDPWSASEQRLADAGRAPAAAEVEADAGADVAADVDAEPTGEHTASP